MRCVRVYLVLIAILGQLRPACAGLVLPDDPWQRDAMLREAEARPDAPMPDAWPRWEKSDGPRRFALELGADAGMRAKAPFGFGRVPRGDLGSSAAVALLDSRWEAHAQWQHWRRPDHGHVDAPDRTWIAAGGEHWAWFAGWVPQWWGPGWEGSLLLSQAARPRPTLGVIAHGTLGGERAWEARLFLAKLERARPVPHPLHWSMRLALRVNAKLSLALERVAQICGHNRTCGLTPWAKGLVGLDNAGQGGITYQNQPGNQLGGISLRWRSPVGDLPYAIYAQGAGEDEAGKLPSKWFWLVGGEIWQTSWRGFVEYVDTRAKAFYTHPELGTVYNHGLYRMGYRAWGRPLGHVLDGDARMLSIGALGSLQGLRWMLVARRWRSERAPHPAWRTQLFVHLRYALSDALACEVQGAAGSAAWGAASLRWRWASE
ncbi:MAG: hypothetical protein D6771_06525 [Zetaproteobacteria bacterium]|nr:MAG: hypothetical protein D6771_06525 [Zetaproteobacteria bacterium]